MVLEAFLDRYLALNTERFVYLYIQDDTNLDHGLTAQQAEVLITLKLAVKAPEWKWCSGESRVGCPRPILWDV